MFPIRIVWERKDTKKLLQKLLNRVQEPKAKELLRVQKFGPSMLYMHQIKWSSHNGRKFYISCWSRHLSSSSCPKKAPRLLKKWVFYFIYEACISNELKNKGYFLLKKKRRNVKVILCHIVCYFGLEMAKNNSLLGFLKKL